MARTYLIRGMLVGLLAAVLAWIVAKTLGESQVGHAISFESAHEVHVPGAPMEHDPVSRNLQSTLGLLTGLVAFGTAIGGIFSLAFSALYVRVTVLNARAASLLIAGAGFLTIYLVPALKYPPNPPSIGNPDTIVRRTQLYFAMLLLSLAIATAVFVAARAQRARWGTWNVCIGGFVVYAVILGVTMALLPRVHETPAGFPADVLYKFRLSSMAIQLTIYATIGLTFGALTERAQRRELLGHRASPEPALV